MECIIIDAQGIYIPQIFARNYDGYVTTPEMQERFSILKEGPYAENYWDVWDEVLNEMRIEIDGKTYWLYQDGDLFLYDPEIDQID